MQSGVNAFGGGLESRKYSTDRTPQYETHVSELFVTYPPIGQTSFLRWPLVLIDCSDKFFDASAVANKEIIKVEIDNI